MISQSNKNQAHIGIYLISFLDVFSGLSSLMSFLSRVSRMTRETIDELFGDILKRSRKDVFVIFSFITYRRHACW